VCFSAEASFAASAVLGAGGVWTLRLGPAPGERPLAAIPLLFAVQQFVEGLVWVGVVNELGVLTVVFSYVFAFFALFLWPIYVPLAVLRVEPDARRRRIQEALLVVGLCVAVLITGSLVRSPLQTGLAGGHLRYHMRLPLLYESLGLYFLAVSAPCFSSHRYLRTFGVLLLLSLAISLWRYAADFISIWCFFAALLSASVLLHFRSLAREDPGRRRAARSRRRRAARGTAGDRTGS
jgi:hypothetical protein